MKPNQRSYPTLKAWRDANDYTQHEAAAVLGISQKSYSRFERRQRFVRGELLKALMSKTRVPLEELVGVA